MPILRAAALSGLAALCAAQSPTWYGLRPSTGGGGVDLVELTDAAAVSKFVGKVAVPQAEYVHTDAMRCLPGFCAFFTTNYNGVKTVSYAYRLNSATAAVESKTPLAGDCAHAHADFSTGHLYTLCIDENAAGGFAAVVFEVAGAAPNSVADITKELAGGRTLPGQTTHCSAFHSMYVGASLGGAGKDVIVTVDLVAGKASNVAVLKSALSRTLWARCDGSNEIGGLGWAPGAEPAANGTASFGIYSTVDGSFKALASVGVPPPLEPSGLLTETETEQSIGAFYPPGTRTNNTGAVKGALWAIDPFTKTGDDELTDFG